MLVIAFGSVARAEETALSDIDLMLVLPNDADRDGDLEFRRKFVVLQRRHGYIPDFTFPAEIISTRQLIDAMRWRGIPRSPTPELPPLGPDDWDDENEHRQWLCAMAGPNLCLHGDRIVFGHMRLAALASVSILELSASQATEFDISTLTANLLKGGKERLGFCSTQGTLNYLAEHIGAAVRLLCEVRYAESVTPGVFRCNPSQTTSALRMLVERSGL